MRFLSLGATLILISILSACGLPEAKVPAAGPRAAAWIEAYIEAARSGAEEAEAIEYANVISRSRAVAGGKDDEEEE